MISPQELRIEELRIGNYVLGEVEDWKIGRVVAINVMGDNEVSLDIDSVSYLIKDLRPIPLSEDILIKMGFHDHGTFWSSSWGTNGVAVITYSQHYQMFMYQLGQYVDKGVQYVHQLQNLYFALTGTELTLSTTKELKKV